MLGEFDGQPFDMVTGTSVAVAAEGGNLVYGDSFSGEVSVYNAAGKLLRIFRLTDPRQRLTDADVEARLARTIPTNVTGTARTERLARLRSLPHSDTWPLYFGLQLSREGVVWLHDFNREDASANVWTGIDSTGQVIGRLELSKVPPRTRRPVVHEFGANYVMLRRFDADMANYLSTYPLVRVDNRR